MSWAEGQAAWSQFLEDVEKKRAEIYCSVSNAWFRGQEDSTWSLVTSLFRHEHRTDADTEKRIKDIDSGIKEAKEHLGKCQKRLARISYDLAQLRKTDAPVPTDVEQELTKRRAQSDRWKKDLTRLTQQKRVLEAVHYGEREAFVEFAFRAGHAETCSWEVLAEMQHYRAPTRLLDWSEVLAISVYFALKSYIRELMQIWEPKPEPGQGLLLEPEADGRLAFCCPKSLPVPRVWILNPYRLSRLARKENALWDPTRDQRHDYFESLFVNYSWEFELPVPIYIPWRNARIAAQRAMFTVQGLNTQSLDIQLGLKNDVLRYVDLKPEAAVYGVKHLMNFLGLNAFAIFQDLDSLGTEIKRHFIIPNTRTPTSATLRPKMPDAI